MTNPLPGAPGATHPQPTAGRIHMLHQTSDAVFYHVFGTSVTAAPDTWAIRDERVAAPAKPPTQVADLAVRSDGSVIAVYGDSAGLRYRIRTRAKDAAPARACRVCSSHGKPPGYFQRSRAGIPDRKGDHPTPDNYPLTLNALTAACNRTSNRDPVMNLDEATVSTSLDDLARRSLARGVHRGDSRVMRYRHRMAETLNLHPAEIAAMCVLMLRGIRQSAKSGHETHACSSSTIWRMWMSRSRR